MRKGGWQTLRIMQAIVLAGIVACGMPAQAPQPSQQAIVQALDEGRNADALHMANRLLQAAPNSPRLLMLRAIALDLSGQSAQALAAYQKVLHLEPNYLPALESAAQIEYQSQAPDAPVLLHRILALQPSNPTAHAMLGVIEYHQKQYDTAAADFDAAGSLLDAQPGSLMAYAISLAHLGRDAEAVPRLQSLQHLKPAATVVSYDLALEQWRASASEDALATLQPLLSAQPADARAQRLAAAIHESRNETPQAVEMLRAAIQASPGDEANYLDFATLAFTHGSYSVGVDMIALGLQRLPNSAALYTARGVLHAQNGDFDQAMDDFEKAHKLDPAYSMAASAEGIAFSQRHDHKAALEEFRRAVREHPKDALAYYLLAEALSWAPTDANAADNGKGAHEAIALATKATQLDPHLLQAWDLLASQLLQAGDAAQAASACRTALALDPKDQGALYTLILAARKTAPKEELRQLVQRLAEVRKQAELENSQTKRYGRLVEAP